MQEAKVKLNWARWKPYLQMKWLAHCRTLWHSLKKNQKYYSWGDPKFVILVSGNPFIFPALNVTALGVMQCKGLKCIQKLFFVVATFKFSLKNCAFSQLEVFKIWLEAGTTADLRKKFGRSAIEQFSIWAIQQLKNSAIQHLSIWAIQQFSIEAIKHPDRTAVWSGWVTAASRNTCSLYWYRFCLHLVWTKSGRGAAESPSTARLLQGEEGDFLSESDQPKPAPSKLFNLNWPATELV